MFYFYFDWEKVRIYNNIHYILTIKIFYIKNTHMKKICILFCGGTFSMIKNKETGSLDVINWAEQIFDLEPRIAELADINIEFIDNINSTNATPDLREKVGEKISKLYDVYDGFVITTGTDTMAYMSSALSFSLTNLQKPVIITWAQIPLETISSDGRANLINSLRVANLWIQWVYLVFWSRIILWCKAQKTWESDLQAFETYNGEDAWSIWIWIKLTKEQNIQDQELPFTLRNWFEWNIMTIHVTPWISCDLLLSLLDQWVQWVILKWYGTGDIPKYIFPFLEQAKKMKIPIIQATQCRGSTILGIYSIGLEALALWVIESYDMSSEAMSTKLMWALAQNITYTEMRSFMHTNVSGEINTRKADHYRSWDIQDEIDKIYKK